MDRRGKGKNAWKENANWKDTERRGKEEKKDDRWERMKDDGRKKK